MNDVESGQTSYEFRKHEKQNIVQVLRKDYTNKLSLLEGHRSLILVMMTGNLLEPSFHPRAHFGKVSFLGMESNQWDHSNKQWSADLTYLWKHLNQNQTKKK